MKDFFEANYDGFDLGRPDIDYLNQKVSMFYQVLPTVPIEDFGKFLDAEYII